MNKFREIEHTADIGIEVDGDSLEDLLINATNGMLHLLVDCKPLTTSQCDAIQTSKDISVNAADREDLLVKWLEEVLYLFETRKLFPVTFIIGRINDTSLLADVFAVPLKDCDYKIRREIKAVTYHNLKISEDAGHFSTTIIFDI